MITFEDGRRRQVVHDAAGEGLHRVPQLVLEVVIADAVRVAAGEECFLFGDKES